MCRQNCNTKSKISVEYQQRVDVATNHDSDLEQTCRKEKIPHGDLRLTEALSLKSDKPHSREELDSFYSKS